MVMVNISADECKMFWCCGKLDACDIKRLNKEKSDGFNKLNC